MNSLVKDTFKKLDLLQSQCQLDFLWGRWIRRMTRHSSTLFHTTCCPRENFLVLVGTGWQCAKIIQSRLGGLEILQSTEDAQLVQAVVRQPVTQMLHDIGAAPKILTKKWWKHFAAKPDYCLTDKRRRQRSLLKTNKQTVSCLEPHHGSARPQVFLVCCYEFSLSTNDDWELHLANSSLNYMAALELTHWCWPLERSDGREVGRIKRCAMFKNKWSLSTAKTTVSGRMWWGFQTVAMKSNDCLAV